MELQDPKKCTRCGEMKPRGDYYPKVSKGPNAIQSHCKSCHKQGMVDYRRRRMQEPAYREATNAVRAAAERRRRATRPEIRRKRNVSKYRREKARLGTDPDFTQKHLARRAIRRAVARGRIVKPPHCEKCCEPGHELHGHHDDYAKRLEVRWLCGPCHRGVHDQPSY